MEKKINNISINDLFWVQFNDSIISFGFNRIQKDIHFTISFEKDKKDINLHITKNVKTKGRKPAIRILVIDKQTFKNEIGNIAITFLRNILEPIDRKDLDRRKKPKFLSYKDLSDSGQLEYLEPLLKDSFKGLVRIRKKSRVKIEGNIDNGVEEFANNIDLSSLINDNLVNLPSEYSRPFDGGVIITKTKTIHTIRIKDKWYTFRQNLSIFDYIKTLFHFRLAYRILKKTVSALYYLKDASTYEDVKKHDNPIRIIKSSNKKQ